MWNEVFLSDVCEIVAGFAFKSKDFGDYPDKVIKIADINPPTVNMATLCGINIEKYDKEKLKKFIAKESDYILAMTGATIGKLGRILSGSGYINQRVALFKPNEKVNKDFLYYILSMPKFNKFIQNHIDSETAQPNISATTIGKYNFSLPPLETQKKVAEILANLDSKIELNDKIKENLENQAQALYKSWFIDFEPFNGQLPKDWKTGKVGEIVENYDSKRVPLSSNQRSNMKKTYPYYGAASLMDYVEDYIFDGIYLLLGEDGTVADEKGYPILQYVWGKFWVNNHAHILKGKNGFNVESLYLFFKQTQVSTIITGAVQAKISQANLNSLDVIIPANDIMQKFNSLIEPIFSQIRKLTDENKSLAQLRDTLLPKLMSGELEV